LFDVEEWPIFAPPTSSFESRKGTWELGQRLNVKTKKSY